jgi:uncharacterized protein YqhQ
MGFWRTWRRFMTAVQLLPALEGGEETLVGGQAVLEGVMMRSPHAWAISCRKPSGEMVSHAEPLERLSEKHPWMGWPMLRGVMTLGHAMVLGYRALKFSANAVLDEMPGNQGDKKIEFSGWLAALNVVLSVGFFIFVYKFLPLLAATEMKRVNPVFGGQVVFNLVDGVVRIALFLAFIWGVSRWQEIRRVYQYHGAEHKTVFAFEAGSPLEVSATQKFSTFHPRCGTSFLMTVMLISIAVYIVVQAVFPVTTFGAKFAVRIVLLPVITGLSYEIIRYAARHRGSLFALMTAPGLWLQRITTQPPSDAQVECAISALNQAMTLETQRGGELVIA